MSESVFTSLGSCEEEEGGVISKLPAVAPSRMLLPMSMEDPNTVTVTVEAPVTGIEACAVVLAVEAEKRAVGTLVNMEGIDAVTSFCGSIAGFFAGGGGADIVLVGGAVTFVCAGIAR